MHASINLSKKIHLLAKKKLHFINSGATSSIYLFEEYGKTYVVKIWFNNDNGFLNWHDLYIQCNLKHQNIIKAIDIRQTENGIGLQLPFFPYTLEHYINKFSITSKDIDRFFNQILSALSYLHKCRIIHGDVKPDNIMVDKDGNFSLIDFSSSSHFKWLNNWPVSSPGYCPIEGYDTTTYGCWDDKLDSWSFGCTLYHLISGNMDKYHDLFDKDRSVSGIINQYLGWHKFLVKHSLSKGEILTIYGKSGKSSRRSTGDDFGFIKKLKNSIYYPIIIALLQVDPTNRLSVRKLSRSIGGTDKNNGRVIKPGIEFKTNSKYQNQLNKFINDKMKIRRGVKGQPEIIKLESKLLTRLRRESLHC